MINRILITILAVIIIMQTHAQDYKHAAGLRLGLSSGITYEIKVDQFRSYNGLLSFREGGMQFTALIESTRPIYANFTDKLYYYTGIGAHVGFTRFQPREGFYANPFRIYYSYGHFRPVIGMDAIIGLEYRLKRVPLSFTLDAKPFFELFGQNIFRLALFDIGLSMKFYF